MFRNPITYPLSGLLSILVGFIIINSGLNVHSGELFLWLIGLFGFVVILPIVLFAKSIQVLTRRMENEKPKNKIVVLVLTVLLGLSWLTLLAVGISG